MAENNNKPMDNAIDALIRSASSDIVTEMFDKIDASINDEDIHFSENHIRAMNKILYSQTVADDNRIKHFRLNKRLILVAIITMTIILIAALSVGADRLKFLDYFMNISEEGTEFRIDESNENESTYMYKATLNYIPENFYLDSTELTDTTYIATYKNSNTYFTVFKSSNPNVIDINTENSKTQKVNINGNVAFLSNGKDFKNIFWIDNNTLYNLYGNIDKEMLIKIAENIE